MTMADLRNQRRMAAEILKCGENRVWMNPDRLDEVEDCITRADIRTAIASGLIKAKAKNGTSRARTRYVAGQKASGKRKGPGSRKGTANARAEDPEGRGEDLSLRLQALLQEGQGRHVQVPQAP